MNVIVEKQRQTEVIAETDVLVAGGGPAGLAAATAAAREGVKVLLVERYGHLGGLGTGGLVICLVETKRYSYGICKEVLERLSDLNAIKLNRTSSDPPYWVDGASFGGEESYYFDPEALKFVADSMIVESGVNLLLHSMVVAPIIKGNNVEGVILEGKSGRQAILAKVIVDTTGDADIAAAAGARYEIDRHPWGINLEFRLGNVDVERATRWKEKNPQLYERLMDKLKKEVGNIRWGKSIYQNVAWCHGPHFRDVDGLNTRHLTRVEVESRKAIIEWLGILRQNLVGFESAFVMETSSQIGVRETRRVVGQYTLTKDDALAGRKFDDAVMHGIFDIPYRCLVPKGVEGLLVAGRCISTTHEAQGVIRNIPPCLITGQAAGTSAALAAKGDIKPGKMDINHLKRALKEQGIKL